MKNTIANNYHHSAAEWGEQEGHQWMKPSNMRSQSNGRGRMDWKKKNKQPQGPVKL